MPIIIGGSDLLKYQVLLARGQSGLARIERFYDTSSKSTVTHHVEYAYVYNGVPHDEKDIISDADFPRYKVGQDVPILLNPNKVGWSIVAPDGKATLRARNQRAVGVIKLFAAIAASIAALLGGLQFGAYYRESRLLKWGKPAQARIVSTRDYSVKGQDYLKVLYQFDLANATFSGRSDIALEDFPRIREAPLVLYDPAQPSRSKLYPFNCAELLE
jgi:hypothetical protein